MGGDGAVRRRRSCRNLHDGRQRRGRRRRGGGGGVGDGGRASLPPELSLLTGTFVFVVWIENGEGRGRHELLYPGTFSPGW
jgi:hypothetical protein